MNCSVFIQVNDDTVTRFYDWCDRVSTKALSPDVHKAAWHLISRPVARNVNNGVCITVSDQLGERLDHNDT